MRICVIGGGIAGSLLAWRLAGPPGIQVDLYDGPTSDGPASGDAASNGPTSDGPTSDGAAPTPDGAAPVRGSASDATAVSGGLVRGFEPDLAACRLAAESLAELLTSPVLRAWAGYVEAGSTYTCTARPPDQLLSTVDSHVPGSVELTGATVRERRAGHIVPDRLRRAVLLDATRAGLTIHTGQQLPVAYDRLVLATGRWTGRVLDGMGLSGTDYRTKLIQVAHWAVEGERPGPFVDEPTGLYGRPERDGMLLGVATDRWGVDPDRPAADTGLLAATRRAAEIRLPGLRLGKPGVVTAAADCYTEPPGLRLRAVPGGPPGLFTFTGGSGGAAKSALAASRAAAAALVDHESSAIASEGHQ